MALSVAGGLWAADPEYQAGIATAGHSKALVLEDRRGGRAIFAEADFAVTQAIADFVAARLLQSYELPRPSLLLRGAVLSGAGVSGLPPVQPEDLLTAISAAMGSMEPASVRFDGAVVSVTSGGTCLAALAAGASLTFDHCTAGAAVRGPIRAAFQMVEPTHGLLQRSDPFRAYPVQAIALGRQVVVVALGGDSALPREFAAKGLLFAPHANDSGAPPDDPRIREAIRQVLSRVRK
ncbi:MAG TPA: hypothetical protein VNY05_20955 [Candidatus Acidoferrales bacterium]|nr:hypothetical protein [Candidatus Acidoferrales bacterium]